MVVLLLLLPRLPAFSVVVTCKMFKKKWKQDMPSWAIIFLLLVSSMYALAGYEAMLVFFVCKRCFVFSFPCQISISCCVFGQDRTDHLAGNKSIHRHFHLCPKGDPQA